MAISEDNAKIYTSNANINDIPSAINSNNDPNRDDLELGAYREYQTFKRLHNMFNNNPTNHYEKNSQMINNAMSNLYLPRISVESFPLMANPAPIGLCAFALTTFVLSVYNAVWPTSPHSVVLGLTLFYGK